MEQNVWMMSGIGHVQENINKNADGEIIIAKDVSDYVDAACFQH